jgi:hypothetical protein
MSVTKRIFTSLGYSQVSTRTPKKQDNEQTEFQQRMLEKTQEEQVKKGNDIEGFRVC